MKSVNCFNWLTEKNVTNLSYQMTSGSKSETFYYCQKIRALVSYMILRNFLNLQQQFKSLIV